MLDAHSDSPAFSLACSTHTRLSTFLPTQMHTCPACLPASLPICLALLPANLLALLPTLPTHLPAHLPTCLLSRLPAYLPRLPAYLPLQLIDFEKRVAEAAEEEEKQRRRLEAERKLLESEVAEGVIEFNSKLAALHHAKARRVGALGAGERCMKRRRE